MTCNMLLLLPFFSCPIIQLSLGFCTLLIGFGFCQALAARGLKSGGTVQQRAERLFLLKVINVLLNLDIQLIFF